jgi:hypothetical protein
MEFQKIVYETEAEMGRLMIKARGRKSHATVPLSCSRREEKKLSMPHPVRGKQLSATSWYQRLDVT